MPLSALDLLAIPQVKYRYAYSLDTKNWTQHRSVLADEVVVDFSGLGHSGPPRSMAADAWVSRVSNTIGSFGMTQHTITNPLIEQDGDEVRLTSYVVAQHALADDPDQRLYELGGRYDDRLIRQDGEWRLSSISLSHLWTSGDVAVWDQAMAMAIAKNKRQA